MSLETLHVRLLPRVGTSTYYRFFTGDSLILYWKRADRYLTAEVSHLLGEAKDILALTPNTTIGI